MEQGTEEWKQARLGRVTASRIADLTARTKTGWGASRANYMAELIAERLSGTPIEGFTSAAMQRGSMLEADARAAYQFELGIVVGMVGFVPHKNIPMSGASPDGLVGEDGLVEIKVPNLATHIDTLLSQTIPGAYVKQMMWQMACTGRSWCDFVSFDDRLPEEMRLFIKRVQRDDNAIGELERAVEEFLAELDAKMSELTSRYSVQEAA